MGTLWAHTILILPSASGAARHLRSIPEHTLQTAWQDVKALTSSCAWVFAPMESRHSTASFWPASAASCKAVCPSFLTACKNSSCSQLHAKRKSEQ